MPRLRGVYKRQSFVVFFVNLTDGTQRSPGFQSATAFGEQHGLFHPLR